MEDDGKTGEWVLNFRVFEQKDTKVTKGTEEEVRGQGSAVRGQWTGSLLDILHVNAGCEL